MRSFSRKVFGRILGALLLIPATMRAARQAGAELIDMTKASIGHDACSASPWVNGAVVEGTAFHPYAAGSLATAERIFAAWRS